MRARPPVARDRLAGGRRRLWGWWLALAGTLVCCGALLSAFAAATHEAAPAEADPDPGDERVAEIVRLVSAGTQLPEGLAFTQRVSARAFLLRWEFVSRLRFEEGRLHVATEGAPAFMPETLPKDLVELGRTLSLFDLQLVREDDGTGLALLSGPLRDYGGQGAREGSFWVDLERGVVQKAEAVYSWGTLSVEQEYGLIEGHLLLLRQSARMYPFGATLEVRYVDYSLPPT